MRNSDMTSIATRANNSGHALATGIEWMIDAYDCDPELLVDLELMNSICRRVISDLNLNVVGSPQSHQFPDPGGVTALYMLSESHLSCHTYPERGLATFNLYCCRARPAWDWTVELQNRLAAGKVVVRQIERGYG